MTQHLEAPETGRRITKRVLGIVALGLVPAALSLVAIGVPLWLSVGSFLAAGLAAGLAARRELKRFRCPHCGAAIRDHMPTGGEPEAPIRYFCAACDVVWNSGLRTPSGL